MRIFFHAGRSQDEVHHYGSESPTDPNAACYKKPDSKIDDNRVSVKCDLDEQSIVQLLVGGVGSHPTGP
jgi:hypothetical protein